jgi:LCP family protein required for cell wall assembly
MGIDREGVVTGGPEDRGHTADMQALLIFDEKAETEQLLLLNRDTMVMMSGLDELGREAGQYYAQLALSHAHGTGGTDSCENVRKTVSEMLYGIHIDYYVSMNMGGIVALNDAVGGVTVEVTDDFTQIDPTIGMGQVTLRGQQAYNFVRTRKGLGDQMNVSRMERHKSYFTGLVEALRNKLETEPEFTVSLYEQISPYIVTDCSVNALTGMMERYADYELTEIVSPEGENVRGERYMEFYLDEEKLDALILRLFYAPK